MIKKIFPFLIFLAFFVQLSNVFNFFGCNPNLILIFCIGGVFLELNPLFYFLPLFLSLFYPPFIAASLVVGGMGLIFSYVRKFLSGNSLLDFNLVLIFGCFLFYLLVDISFIKNVCFVKELIYNLILGNLLYGVCLAKRK